MQKFNGDALNQYQSALKVMGVSDRLMPHYVKWVRYFLDYMAKYGNGAVPAGLVEGFLAKLASKGQSGGLREQARHAVGVYIGLVPGNVPVARAKEGVLTGTRTSGQGPAVDMPSQASSDKVAKPAWDDLGNSLAAEIKRRNYSPKTASTYLAWVRRFGQFLHFKPVGEVSDEDAKDFLTGLAVRENVVASTQNQAFNALLFFFRHILQRDYDLKDRVVRAKRTKYIPAVLTKPELDAVLSGLKFPYDLIVSMLYGCGLRLSECLDLRVNNLDFPAGLVIVHDGKGMKDRSLPLPKKLAPELERQTQRVAKLLEKDLGNPDFAGVFMPGTLGSRRAKLEAKDLQWQWLFPARELTLVPDEGAYRRYHNYPQNLGKAIKEVVRKAKVPKRVTAHTFRHTFASHLLSANVDLRTIQQLLGHSDIRTTMIYTHTVQSRTKKEMVSPLDLDWEDG